MSLVNNKFVNLLLESGVKTELKHIAHIMKVGDSELVDRLLEYHSVLEYKDESGFNLLEIAVQNDMPTHTVEYLCENGLHSKDVLIMSINQNNQELFNLLIDDDVEVNTLALVAAFKMHNRYFADTLMSKNIDISYKNAEDQNFLDIAIENFISLDLVQQLVDKKIKSKRALFIAARKNNVEVYKLLQNANFDIRLKNTKKRTLYDVAVEFDSYDIQKYIEETQYKSVYIGFKIFGIIFSTAFFYFLLSLSGIFTTQVNMYADVDHHSGLIFAISLIGGVLLRNQTYSYIVLLFDELISPQFFYVHRKKIVALFLLLLLTLGFFLSPLSKDSPETKNNKLFEYVQNNEYSNFKELSTDKSLSLNIQDREGNTLLMIALKNHNSSIVDLLLSKVVMPNIKNSEGKTALFYNSDVDVLAKLLKKGADINTQDKYGNSILHIFVEKYISPSKYKDFLLYKSGIDFTLKNVEGKTALDILKERKKKRESYDDDLYEDSIKSISNLIKEFEEINKPSRHYSNDITEIENFEVITTPLFERVKLSDINFTKELEVGTYTTFTDGRELKFMNHYEMGFKIYKKDRIILKEEFKEYSLNHTQRFLTDICSDGKTLKIFATSKGDSLFNIYTYDIDVHKFTKNWNKPVYEKSKIELYDNSQEYILSCDENILLYRAQNSVYLNDLETGITYAFHSNEAIRRGFLVGNLAYFVMKDNTLLVLNVKFKKVYRTEKVFDDDFVEQWTFRVDVDKTQEYIQIYNGFKTYTYKLK